MALLPADVLIEILVRLPVKTLLRFHCVSKAWRALITSNYFVDIHLNHARKIQSNNKRVILIEQFPNDEREPLVSFHTHYKAESLSPTNPESELHYLMDIHGSSNGIVCFSELDDVFLCNPATLQFLRLPACLITSRKGFKCTYPAGTGFGFASATKDYKVLRLYHLCQSLGREPQTALGGEIYKLSTNSWRKLDPLLPLMIPQVSCAPALFNGSLHWQAFNFELLGRILSFDLRTEVFRQTEYPKGVPNLIGRSQIFVLDDAFLAIFLIKHVLPEEIYYLPINCQESIIDIWVLMEYGNEESWVKKFSLGTLAGGLSLPMSVWDDDKLFLLQIQSWDDKILISCSVQDNCQEIQKFDCITNSGGTLRALDYHESLVSLMEDLVL